MDQANFESIKWITEQKKKLRVEEDTNFDLEKMPAPAAIKDAMKHNTIPSELAIGLAQSMRRKAEDSVAGTEERILRIDHQIQELQRERKALVKSVQPSWAKIRLGDVVLSPFRRMSLELLQVIAKYAIPQQPSPLPDQAPVSLAHVCRPWRKATLSLPSLWRALWLDIDRVDTNRRLSFHANMIRQWFQRTGSHRLSLHLYFHPSFRNTTSNSLIAFFLNPLRSTLLRIKTLSVGGPSASRFLSLLDRYFWGLERFTIKNDPDGEIAAAIQTLPRWFQNLKGLTVENPSFYSMFSNNSFPCSKLTALQIGRTITLAEYRNILSAFPLLFSASFALDEQRSRTGIDRYVFSPTNPFVRNSLRSLSLNILDNHLPIGKVLSVCRTENLEILRIGHHSGMPDTDDGQTPRFRSQLRKLDQLTLFGNWCNAHDLLLGILRSPTDLNSLHLDIDLNPVRLFQSLSADILEDIYVDPNDSVDSDDSSISQSKWVYNLSDLAILSVRFRDDCQNLDPDAIQAMKTMLHSRLEARVFVASAEDLIERLEAYTFTFQVAAESARLKKTINDAVQPLVAQEPRLIFRFLEDKSYTPWHAPGSLEKWQNGIEARTERVRSFRRKGEQAFITS